MSTSDFFTNDEIEKFTLPDEEEYRDIDRLQATISVNNAEVNCGSFKKRNLQRNSSAYALFFRENQPILRAQNKNATFGEISRAIARKWEKSNSQLKKEYKKRVQLIRKKELMDKAVAKAFSVLDNNHSQRSHEDNK